MTELRAAHTADLDAKKKAAVRGLMDAAFGGVSDDTFENVLGGVHALVFDGGELVGHGSVVQRRLLHGGRALRTGYVEGVAVRADRRRRGHGALIMTSLERVIRAAYQLGALGASAEGSRLYTARGLAAVARTVLGPVFGRNPAHRGQGRRDLRTAGIGAGRRVRRAGLRLAAWRPVVAPGETASPPGLHLRLSRGLTRQTPVTEPVPPHLAAKAAADANDQPAEDLHAPVRPCDRISMS